VLNGTIPFPTAVVMGHEGAGVVESVGSLVQSIAPGDDVVIATLASRGACGPCSSGHPTWCLKTLRKIDAFFAVGGTPTYNFAACSVFAERTIVKEVQAVKIPKETLLTSACLIACGVLTGAGAVLNRCKVRPGDTAAVFGVDWAYDCVGHSAVFKNPFDALG
jgi:S-(hydroxymethyl)glutathione dehydrogenase/alcohol dehydrogenase